MKGVYVVKLFIILSIMVLVIFLMHGTKIEKKIKFIIIMKNVLMMHEINEL